MIEIDKISQLVTCDTDATLADLERAVARENYTLNYYCVPHNRAVLAEALEQRLPNVFADAFGGIEELCVQALWAQPDGSVFKQVLAPRSATGPDYKKLAIGARGELGVPIQATLKVFRAPARRHLACLIFSQSKNLELFRKALPKLPFRIPLLRAFPPRLLREIFPDLQAGHEALGVGLWGEAKVADAQLSYILDEAEKRKALPGLLEDEALFKKAWSALLELAPCTVVPGDEGYGDGSARRLAERISSLR